MRRAAAAALALLLASGGAAGDSLVAKGERLFAYCYACHSLVPGEANLPGPNLAGIVGGPVAAQEDFRYSPAMLRFAQSEGRWTEPLLDLFLADPEAAVAGTWMSAPSLAPEERAALIAYLRASTGVQ